MGSARRAQEKFAGNSSACMECVEKSKRIRELEDTVSLLRAKNSKIVREPDYSK